MERMKLILALAALSLSGCMFHNVQTHTMLDRTVCPDPPPAHPDAIVGSTPCVVLPENKHTLNYNLPYRYIRSRTGGSSSGVLPMNGEPAFEDTKHSDYDVSRDGVHWFHLLGEICWKDLKKALPEAIK